MFRDNDDPNDKRYDKLEWNEFHQTDIPAHIGKSMDHLKKHQANLSRINLDDLKSDQTRNGNNPDQLRNHWQSVASLVAKDPAFSSFVSQVSQFTKFIRYI